MVQHLTIVIVDDEKDMRESIGQWLSLSGYKTKTFASAEDALQEIGPDYPGIVMTDVRMPKMDGITFLKRLQSQDSNLPVILITGHGDVSMAVDAMQIGAYDFLEKPFNTDRMAEIAKRALQTRKLMLENRALRRELSDASTLLKRMAGRSPVMAKLREDILDLSQADGHVIITGETGTGKSLIAHALHACGPRAGKDYISIAAAAHDEADLNEMLFTSNPDKKSLIERAKGGTFCIEDIGSLPISTQSKLLDILIDQDGSELNPLRIIGISNDVMDDKPLEQRLRGDFYFRLAAMYIQTPPLRIRGEDILTLFNRYSENFAEEYGCPPPNVSAEDAANLLQAPWPGNIRQLINLAERAVLQSRRGSFSISALLLTDTDKRDYAASEDTVKPLKEHVEAFERMLIDNTMRRHKGLIQAVMDELHLPRRTLNEKMAKYGLSRSDYVE